MTTPRGLIGVVHLPAMPGDPRPSAGFAAVEAFALTDAEAWAEGGVTQVVIENFGSAPFSKGTEGHRLPPHQVAAMAIVARAITSRLPLRVGINCLRNDGMSAIGIAAAASACFVRVNVHVGAYVTDQGLVEGEAATTVRYRSGLGADLAILADVNVKHAAPLAPRPLQGEIHDAFDRGLADAIVITGEATGARASRASLEIARSAAGTRPVVLGSGLLPDDAEALLPLCDAAIVGTWAKHGGRVDAPVDPARVRALVEASTGRFAS